MPKAPSGMTDQEIDAVLSSLGGSDLREDTDADFRAQADFVLSARPMASAKSPSRRPSPLAPPKSIAPKRPGTIELAPTKRSSAPPPLPTARRSAPPAAAEVAPHTLRASSAPPARVVPPPFPSTPALSSGAVSLRAAPPPSPSSLRVLDDEHTDYRPARSFAPGMLSSLDRAEDDVKATLASFATSDLGRVEPGSSRPVTVSTAPHGFSKSPHAAPPPPSFSPKGSSRSLPPGSLRSLGPVTPPSPNSVRRIPPSAMSTGQLEIPPAELSSPRVRVGGRSTSSWAAAFVAVGAFTGIIAGFVFRGEAAVEHAASLVDSQRTTSAQIQPAAMPQVAAKEIVAPLPANIDLAAAAHPPQTMFVAPAADSKIVEPVKVEPVKAVAKAEAPKAEPAKAEAPKAEPVRHAVARPVYHAPKPVAKEAEEPAPKPVAAKAAPLSTDDGTEEVKPTKASKKKAGSAQSEADRLAQEQLEQSL